MTDGIDGGHPRRHLSGRGGAIGLILPPRAAKLSIVENVWRFLRSCMIGRAGWYRTKRPTFRREQRSWQSAASTSVSDRNCRLPGTYPQANAFTAEPLIRFPAHSSASNHNAVCDQPCRFRNGSALAAEIETGGPLALRDTFSVNNGPTSVGYLSTFSNSIENFGMKVAIIGAGLAGSVLAHFLSDFSDVSVVELGKRTSHLKVKLRDAAIKAGYAPHVGSGPGGTSAYWHNGLIEPAEEDFGLWPITKSVIDPYFAESYKLLSGVSREAIQAESDRLKDIHISRGIPPELIGNSLYYPRQRRNLWRSLHNESRPIDFIVGRAQHLILTSDGRVDGVAIHTGRGVERLGADIVICCAGGLGTPVVLHETARRYGLAFLDVVGKHYYDHPYSTIAELRLRRKFYDIWNYSPKNLHGSLRTPLVLRDTDGRKTAFYLRPASVVRSKAALKSALSDLRNSPFDLKNIFKFLGNPTDVIEFASFMAGMHIPTDQYALMIAAEQSPDGLSWVEGNAETGEIVRHWQFGDQFRRNLHEALKRFLEAISPLIVDCKVVPNWDETLSSGAHHSGTCRIAQVPSQGVCDSNNEVFGVKNAFICDGSAIPGAGFANTGLTIAALALRLVDTVRARMA